MGQSDYDSAMAVSKVPVGAVAPSLTVHVEEATNEYQIFLAMTDRHRCSLMSSITPQLVDFPRVQVRKFLSVNSVIGGYHKMRAARSMTQPIR